MRAIACLGAGRMARGIAVVFAYAGHRVTIVDVKARDAAGYASAAAEALAEVRSTLGHARRLRLVRAGRGGGIAARVSVVRGGGCRGRARAKPR